MEFDADYSLLSDMELWECLKKNENSAWAFTLKKVFDQEKCCRTNNQKRHDWNVSLESLLGQLHEDMIVFGKINNYKGCGSLIGWMRTYVRGYLNRQKPDDSRTRSIDAPIKIGNGEEMGNFEESVSFDMSEHRGRNAYLDEDLHVLRNEEWEIAQVCFKNLWMGNSMQAYVMLLKTRFHMSSMEIMKRFGLSSTANVDQMFARAVKRMKEARSAYGKG